MRILVTGATGFVGQHLVAKLKAGGNQVVALRRGGAASAGPDILAGPADLAEIDRWDAWPAAVEAVVHLAALNPGRREAGAADPAALRHANVDGTAALARRAAREGVGRMIFLSSANVHAARNGAGIRESDPLAPRSPYAVSKKQAEEAFWNNLAGTATQGCVLRPAPVYGAGGRGNVASLVKLARLPIPLPLEGLGGPRSLVAVDHLIEVIALCLDAPGAAGETFLVADEGPLAPAGIVRALRQGWRRAPRLLPAPAGPLGRLATVAGKGKGWEAATQPFVLDTSHLHETLGWRSPIGTAEKLRELAAAGAL